MPTKIKSTKAKSLWILGQEVTVEYRELPDDDGEFSSAQNRIVLDPRHDDEFLRRTLIHEFVHGVLFYSGMVELLGEKQVEALCCLFETALTDYVDFT